MRTRITLITIWPVLILMMVSSGIASAAPVDQTKLPQVFILGDSISQGYTIPVRDYLKDKAVVTRPNDNCKNSAYLLAHLKEWLGANKYDVIHFNCGIWDTFIVDKKTKAFVDETKADPQSIQFMAPVDEYRSNLTAIITILEGSGKRLVWASSTPVSDRQGARAEDIPHFNAIAASVMKEHGIPIDDLYAFVRPHTPAWQIDFCHFDIDGYELLGKQVGQSILDALAKPIPAAK